MKERKNQAQLSPGSLPETTVAGDFSLLGFRGSMQSCWADPDGTEALKHPGRFKGPNGGSQDIILQFVHFCCTLKRHCTPDVSYCIN